MHLHTRSKYHQMANSLQSSIVSKYFQPNGCIAKSLQYLEPMSGVTRFNEFFTTYHMHQLYNKDFLDEIILARRQHISQLMILPTQMHLSILLRVPQERPVGILRFCQHCRPSLCVGLSSNQICLFIR